MIGKTFGSFIVIERDILTHPQAAAKYWKVKCIYCGQEKIIRADYLKKNQFVNVKKIL